jgi:hypothetical protein
MEDSATILIKPISPVRRHVNPAAHLRGRLAELHHADLVAVFVAEKRHGPGGLGLGEGHFGHPFGARDVAQDVRVGVGFNLLNLLRRGRARVGIVETQFLRRDRGAGLGDVGAQHPPQGRVQQVGRGVVAHNRLTPRSRHRGRYGGFSRFGTRPFCKPTAGDSNAMNDQSFDGLLSIENIGLPVGVGDCPGIAHRPAAFGIKGGFA